MVTTITAFTSCYSTRLQITHFPIMYCARSVLLQPSAQQTREVLLQDDNICHPIFMHLFVE